MKLSLQVLQTLLGHIAQLVAEHGWQFPLLPVVVGYLPIEHEQGDVEVRAKPLKQVVQTVADEHTEQLVGHIIVQDGEPVRPRGQVQTPSLRTNEELQELQKLLVQTLQLVVEQVRQVVEVLYRPAGQPHTLVAEFKVKGLTHPLHTSARQVVQLVVEQTTQVLALGPLVAR